MTAEFDYVREPGEIYRRSFAAIEKLEEVAALEPAIRTLAVRVIHACGMPDIAPDLRYSERAVAAGRKALKRGSPVLCDVESVRAGIMARLLPRNVQIHCRISAADTETHAATHRMTRAAAQIDLWGERIEDSILVIGNAPTALFRLLENVGNGGPKPALVLGFPVGFVGAAESKQALADNCLGIEFVTLLGRRGGSAMAAAAMNALAGELAI